MLDTGKGRDVSVRFQDVHDVLGRIVHAEPTMGEAQHAGGVRIHAGQEACPAGRAGWSSGKSFAEGDALFSELLKVRSGDCVTIRLDECAGVVRVKKDDVRSVHGCSVCMREEFERPIT